MLMEGTVVQLTNLQPLSIATVLLGLETEKPNSKKTWEVSLWKEWGTGVWECEFICFVLPLLIMIVNDFFPL